MVVKVTVLMENSARDDRFDAEHGLSLSIETERRRLLFDTGASERFADNAHRLGIDLNDVDLAVISHGHYDHGGGLRRFFQCNDRAPVYISRYAFDAYYSGPERYIGLDAALKESGRFVFVGDELKIAEDLALVSCNGRARRFASDHQGLDVMRGGRLQADDFRHEQYLLIEDAGRRILLSGCSHKGILNIVDWLRPDVMIGGFHFMNLDLSAGQCPALDQAAERLLGYDTTYYTCHCTGQAQYAYLKARMGERLHSLSTGQVCRI